MAIVAVFKNYKPKEDTTSKVTTDFIDELAKPAQRALSGAGVTTLKQLAKMSEEEVSLLHGIGQNAIEQLKQSLGEHGLSFAKKKK